MQSNQIYQILDNKFQTVTYDFQIIDTFPNGSSGWLIYNTHGLDNEGWGPLSSSLLDELLDRMSALEYV